MKRIIRKTGLLIILAVVNIAVVSAAEVYASETTVVEEENNTPVEYGILMVQNSSVFGSIRLVIAGETFLLEADYGEYEVPLAEECTLVICPADGYAAESVMLDGVVLDVADNRCEFRFETDMSELIVNYVPVPVTDKKAENSQTLSSEAVARAPEKEEEFKSVSAVSYDVHVVYLDEETETGNSEVLPTVESPNHSESVNAESTESHEDAAVVKISHDIVEEAADKTADLVNPVQETVDTSAVETKREAVIVAEERAADEMTADEITAGEVQKTETKEKNSSTVSTKPVKGEEIAVDSAGE